MNPDHLFLGTKQDNIADMVAKGRGRKRGYWPVRCHDEIELRWDEAHVALIKRAAAVLGVPLSSYVKQVLVRQALADIAQDAAVR